MCNIIHNTITKQNLNFILQKLKWLTINKNYELILNFERNNFHFIKIDMKNNTKWLNCFIIVNRKTKIIKTCNNGFLDNYTFERN